MTGLLGDSKDLKKALGGEPAFPQVESDYDYFDGGMNDSSKCVSSVSSAGGLTKREWLSGRAMQGLVSMGPVKAGKVLALTNPTEIAEVSVAYADALLQELERAALPEENV